MSRHTLRTVISATSGAISDTEVEVANAGCISKIAEEEEIVVSLVLMVSILFSGSPVGGTAVRLAASDVRFFFALVFQISAKLPSKPSSFLFDPLHVRLW